MALQNKAVAFAGGLSGACQVLAEQPFDTVKIRLQSRINRFTILNGPVAMVQTTFQQEGIKAFFRGLTPRLLTYSTVKFCLFSLYEYFKKSTGIVPLAGALAGGINTVISCPQDVLKSQLQVQLVRQQYQGPISTLKALLQTHGPKFAYFGWRPLVFRDVLGYALLYSTFHYTTTYNLFPTFICGGLSGVAFYLSTLPIDRVKTVMMTLDFRDPMYRTASHAARSIYSQEGFLGLYRGCIPTLSRTFVGQAVALTVYSNTLKALQD